MARLVTGYDFAATEIPTKAKLHQMLAGMSVAAISPALINSSLVGVNFGTSGTTLPAEGWMWADISGTLWVRTTNGSAKLWRSQGGWSTIRFPTLGVIDTITLPQTPNGARAILRNRIAHGGDAGDTNESNVGWFQTADQSGTPIGKGEDTTVSGVFSLWVMRGGVVWQYAIRAAMPDLFRRHSSPGQTEMQGDVLPLTDANSRNNQYFGFGSVNISTAQCFGWMYGGIERVY
jgi:hypothetical protein